MAGYKNNKAVGVDLFTPPRGSVAAGSSMFNKILMNYRPPNLKEICRNDGTGKGFDRVERMMLLPKQLMVVAKLRNGDARRKDDDHHSCGGGYTTLDAGGFGGVGDAGGAGVLMAIYSGCRGSSTSKRYSKYVG
ncbi:hypothetical protein HAX54_034687 [Datura stramonium]|uniref:Uncharacterized protein n=1 Tax=Datura stramonium TaxID=4076 RepID=A0ABS8VED0_DATST|nr:hypothetical protein [Datura stramonium]